MNLTDNMLSPIPEEQAKRKNPLVLAYIGDTVFDLYVRTHIIKKSDAMVRVLHKNAIRLVSARAQAAMTERLPQLTDAEMDVFRRGRNAKPGSLPKNMTVAEYHLATALEALIGYLYLSGQYDRLEEIMDCIKWEEE